MRVTHFFGFKFSEKSLNFDKSKNYYKILNIQPTSSKAIIRNAYLNLAKKYHPDVNSSGKQRFTLIQQAYQVLSNQKHKKDYETFFKQQFSSSQSYHQRNSEGFRNWNQAESPYMHYKNYQGSEFKGHRTNSGYQQYNWQTQFQGLQRNRKKWSEQFEQSQKSNFDRSQFQSLNKENIKKVIFQNTQEGMLQRLWNRFIK